MQYAANDGGGNIITYALATPADPNLTNVTDAGVNYDFAAAATVAGGSALTGNTLRYTGGKQTLDIGADANTTNTLTLNGIMQAGTDTLTIARSDTGPDGTGGVVIAAGNELVIVANNKSISITAPIKDGTGAGSVTFSSIGGGTLTLWGLNGGNTYTGGTTVSSGTLALKYDKNAPSNSNMRIGTGLLTLMPGTTFSPGRINLANDIDATDATITGGNAFGETLSGDITIGGLVTFSYSNSTGHTSIAGDISGSGSMLWIGGTRQDKNVCRITGTNTYTGTTTIGPNGALKFGKQVSLYNANTTKWTADNLIVQAGATAFFSAGAAGQFIAADIDILAGLGTATGGFTDGAYIGFVTETSDFTYGGAIADTNGGANKLGVKKLGNKILTLSGNSTYTGASFVREGTLSVSSINSVVDGSASSNLGAPTNMTDGTIQVIGTLRYTGAGEITDRVFSNGGSNTTIDQSGTGLLKFTSDMLATGSSKTIYLKGSTTAAGEFAGAIAGTSTNKLDKQGTGTWTLSGTNLYTGTTRIRTGTLVVSGSCDNSDVTVNNTGTLGGGGSVKSLAVEDGGMVSPGNSVGTLSVVDGNTSLAANAVYEWQFGGGTSADLVAVTGELTLNDDWKLKLVDIGETPNGTQEYDLFTFTGDYFGNVNFGLGNIDVSEVSWETASASIGVDANSVYITGIGTSALNGDADGNGVVNAADYMALKRHMGTPTGALLADGDFDTDHDVDFADLQLLIGNYDAVSGGAPAIPEPATLFVLLAAGLPALLKRRRSRS